MVARCVKVYHGSWNGTEVAVKKLLIQRMEKKHMREFQAEINILARLRHPNIVLFMAATTVEPDLSIVTGVCVCVCVRARQCIAGWPFRRVSPARVSVSRPS